MKDKENQLESNKKGISGFFRKATDLSKKAVENVQKGAKAFSEKSKQDAFARRMEKYNPITEAELLDTQFKIPNMIVIVESNKRHEVDVLENAVGWITIERDVEVLHLFEDSTSLVSVNFYPNCQCNAVYYIDTFDKGCYVRADCIFGKAHDEKLAELKHIAHSLGAKSCSIEITENHFDAQKSKFSVEGKMGAKASYGNGVASENGEYRSGKIVSIFEGSDTPKKPKLKWYSQDLNIKRLIEARCTQTNSLKAETLQLKGSTSAVMSQKTASAIDLAIGKIGKYGTKSSIEQQSIVESESILIFSVEF